MVRLEIVISGEKYQLDYLDDKRNTLNILSGVVLPAGLRLKNVPGLVDVTVREMPEFDLADGYWTIPVCGIIQDLFREADLDDLDKTMRKYGWKKVE